MSRNEILVRARRATAGDTVQIVGYSDEEMAYRQHLRRNAEALKEAEKALAALRRKWARENARQVEFRVSLERVKAHYCHDVVTSAPELADILPLEQPFPLVRPLLRGKAPPKSGRFPKGSTVLGDFFKGDFFKAVSIFLASN